MLEQIIDAIMVALGPYLKPEYASRNALAPRAVIRAILRDHIA